MIQPDEVKKAIRIAFDKKVKSELQVRKDFLATIFKPRENNAFRTSQDFVGELSTTNERVRAGEAGVTRVDPLAAEQDSPPIQDMPWRRRINNLEADNIHVRMPRAFAKMTSKSLKEYANLVASQVMKTKNRSNTRMDLSLLRSKIHTENIQIIDNPAGNANQEVYLPQGQVLIAPEVGTARAVLTAESFLKLGSVMADAAGVAHGQPSDVSDALGGLKKIALFSNEGWADFVASNLSIYGNRDFVNSNVYIKGYGKIFKMIDDVLIYVIPTNVFNDLALSNLTTAATNAAAFTAADQYVAPAIAAYPQTNPRHGYFTDARRSKEAGLPADYQRGAHNRLDNMHEMLMFYVDSFQLYNPGQLNIDVRNYEDFTKSFQPRTFCQWAKEGMRLYDKVFFRVFFHKAGGSFAR